MCNLRYAKKYKFYEEMINNIVEIVYQYRIYFCLKKTTQRTINIYQTNKYVPFITAK